MTELANDYINYRSQDFDKIEFDQDLAKAQVLDDQADFARLNGEQLDNLVNQIPGNEPQKPETNYFQEVEKFARRLGPNILKGGVDAGDAITRTLLGNENTNKANQWLAKNLPEDFVKFDKDLGGFLNSLDETPDQVVQALSQFAIPFSAYMKGIGAVATASSAEVSSLVKGIGADVVTNFTALDPHIERFAGLMQEIGLQNDFITYLSDTENESEAEGRFKNSVDGLVAFGVMAPLITASGRALKSMWNGGKRLTQKRGEQKVGKATKHIPVQANL